MVKLFAVILCSLFTSVKSDVKVYCPGRSFENLASLVDNTINHFGIKLYNFTRRQSGEQNVVFSPLAIAAALNLLEPGAKAETKMEIDKLLGYNHLLQLQGKEYELFHELLDKLVTLNKQLHLVYKFYIQYGFFIEKRYEQILDQCFNGSRLEEVEFNGEPETSREQINKYVEEKTQSRIKQLLSVGSVNELTRLVLISALYFRANWDTPFTETETGLFTTLAGQKKSVAFMHKKNPMEKLFYTYEFENYDTPIHTLGISYEDQDFDMFFIVPENFKTFEQVLAVSPRFLTVVVNFAAHSFRTDGEVYIPKFTLDYVMPLKAVLRAAGAEKAFTSDANLRAIADSPLFLSDAFHEGLIQVNENGTEAAAATTGVAVNLGKEPAFIFKADKPFVFLIRHRETHAIICLGAVLQPPEALY